MPGSIVPEISPRRIVGESSDRDRSKLPHETVRPAPTERRSQILYETVGWKVKAVRLISCTRCAPDQLSPQFIEEP